MKTLLFALASILFLQSVTARSVALDDTKKTCEDYLKADVSLYLPYFITFYFLLYFIQSKDQKEK